MPAVSNEKYLTKAGWDHAPHLTEKMKREIAASQPSHMLPAVQHGDPTIGIGRVYTMNFSQIECDPFVPPPLWPRVFALDPGWNVTACLWAAFDEANDTAFLYREYYMTHQIARLHAQAILTGGAWVPGVCDPAAEGHGPDGKKQMEVYRSVGLTNLRPANNEVVAGIQAVIDRVVTGRLKAFRTLQFLRHEWGLYHRDKHGKIVKKHDHLLDDLRYLCLGGLNYAAVNPRAVAAHTGALSLGGAADATAGF